MREAIEVTLESIHDRLQKSKALFSEAIPGQTSFQAHLRSFSERYGDPKLARSEELVNPADLIRLKLRTEEMRNGIFMIGQPFNQDPLYREWMREGFLTEPQALRLFFIRDGRVLMKAELDADDYGLGAKIAMTARERERMVDFGIDFLGGYWLNIEYGDPSDESYAEYHAYQELRQMTAEEYHIFSHFMNIGRGIINEKS